MGIPENIDAILVKFDITQDNLARIAKVTPGAVTGWRKGSKPRDDAVNNICNYFNLDRDDILSIKYGLASKEHGNPPTALYPSDPKPAYAPLYGRVHAGNAQEPEIIEDDIPIPYEVYEQHPCGYFLEVEGQCMSRVYPEGCYIYIDPEQPPQNGSIAVVSIDGADYVMRRMYNTGKTLILSPESWEDGYEDIVITLADEHDVSLIGTVVWFQSAEEME